LQGRQPPQLSKEEKMQMMARLCFHVDQAHLGIAALGAQGFKVLTHIFPSEPDHIFIEAMRDEDGEDELGFLHEVSHVVERFDGFVSDAGVIPVGHVPFDYETAVWRDVATD
jgi:hypothetical protein